MRIKLEIDDGLTFSTVQLHRSLPQYRTMMVMVGGKRFAVSRTVEQREIYFHYGDEEYLREVDRALIGAMEKMLGKLLLDACAAVPEGTELL